MTRTVVNLLPYSIYWIQKDTKTFLGCNRYFLTAHTGIVENEAVGKSIDTIFSGKYLNLINEFLEKDVSDAKKSVIYFDDSDSSKEPLLIQYACSLSEGIGVFSEIVIDAKSVDEALWKEKEKLLTYLNNIVEYVPASIYWKDKNSIILGGSQLHAELAGCSDIKEVIGKSDYEFIWKGQAERIIKNDKFVMDSNQTSIFEETAKLKDGEIHTFLTRKSPLKEKTGKTIGVLGVSLDITELKETQAKLEVSLKRAEAANQAKTEFLENMRHDMRTPLSGIVGCAHLIKTQSGSPLKVVAFADDLVQSSEALLEFLNKILESITVSSGEIPVLKKGFNLKEALEQIVRLNKPQALIKGLELSLDYDDNIPFCLIGDGIRVQRIILELLTNALKYTDTGSIKVSAHLIKNKKREVIVELCVSDTGMGIPEDKHKEVYKRFTRLIPSYKGLYPGTGLGLSVVKQFIEDLSGEIHIESEAGKGATFICVMPFQKSLLNETEIGISNELKETSNLPEKIAANEPLVVEVAQESHILVVEDNAIAVRVAQNVLSELGCRTDVAPDGKTAIEKIERNHYDLILMDMGLPDDDGCEITRRVRLKQWQRNPSVPIIGLTAHVENDKKQRCLANGMNAVFNKPLTPEKAAEILSAFISHQDQSQGAIPKVAESLQSISLLNLEQAVKLIGKKEVVKECLDLLVAGLNKELEVIKQQHKSSDWSAIRNMLHKWKGGASYCCASRLEQACDQLVAAIHIKSAEEIEVLYQQLIQVAEDTKEAAMKAIV